MKYIELTGDNIKEDIEEIKREIDHDNNVVFTYSGKGTLYDYITALNDKGRGLDAAYLYKFKVCYDEKNLDISYSRGNNRSRKITSMSSLINELDGKNNCRIVVQTDDRVQLAFIVQQLVYIEYPLVKVDILLRKEEKDASKTKRFMENVNELLEGCNNAILRLIELREQVNNETDQMIKADCLKDIDEALEACVSIKYQIEKSIDVELKFAVAASKKAGKSVIVNCFIGEQIAPTSTELATPNNCFYKRSSDRKYHLRLEGNDEIQKFDSREAIYDVINEHFRNAQNNKDSGFTLPNMYIDYVTKENNFSSYTIFDTAGPDAAGTKHAEVAKNAMKLCDVAVFAIDYSKYLTVSEEEYLREVKEMFTAQNKFHSLIFALNKIDVRYTDVESPKSFVMSVDFLKTRLANINEAYKDCIIFPTCSLEYFQAIEAEKAGVTELLAENNLDIGKMKDVKFAHRDVPSLAWLHTHSENLEYYHGVKTISYDVFKKDSGMPALMSYVSYVAQSKARDEIVNNITFEIASQKVKLQSILDFIVNIEALINADDEKIYEISRIITEYTDSVGSILNSDFREEDLAILEDNDLLKRFGGNYGEFIKHQSKAIKDSCNKLTIADIMYNDMVNQIWDKLQKCDEVSSGQIDGFFTTGDFKILTNKIFEIRIEEEAGSALAQLNKINGEVRRIVEYRQALLEEASDECRNRLLKEDINIELPTLPEFEFASVMPSIGSMIINVKPVNFDLHNKLSELFREMFFKNIGIWFLNLFKPNDNQEDYKYKFSADKSKFLQVCNDKLKDRFVRAVYENDVSETLCEQLEKYVVKGYISKLVKELENTFENMNDILMASIKRFRLAIDDRDKYKANIIQHNKRKSNILNIRNCTVDFMQIWDMIVQDIVDNEKNKDFVFE